MTTKNKGHLFEIKCTRETIINKEARGEDASFERKLLKQWSKYEGWENAGSPFGTREKSTLGTLK